MVYIREAHPKDGRVSQQNLRQGISVNDPKSANERSHVAIKACSILELDMPCLVDAMDDRANRAYGAWPDRIYVIDKSGRIAVAGEPGPFGFSGSLQEAKRWLAQSQTR